MNRNIVHTASSWALAGTVTVGAMCLTGTIGAAWTNRNIRENNVAARTSEQQQVLKDFHEVLNVTDRDVERVASTLHVDGCSKQSGKLNLSPFAAHNDANHCNRRSQRHTDKMLGYVAPGTELASLQSFFGRPLDAGNENIVSITGFENVTARWVSSAEAGGVKIPSIIVSPTFNCQEGTPQDNAYGQQLPWVHDQRHNAAANLLKVTNSNIWNEYSSTTGLPQIDHPCQTGSMPMVAVPGTDTPTHDSDGELVLSSGVSAASSTAGNLVTQIYDATILPVEANDATLRERHNNVVRTAILATKTGPETDPRAFINPTQAIAYINTVRESLSDAAPGFDWQTDTLNASNTQSTDDRTVAFSYDLPEGVNWRDFNIAIPNMFWVQHVGYYTSEEDQSLTTLFQSDPGKRIRAGYSALRGYTENLTEDTKQLTIQVKYFQEIDPYIIEAVPTLRVQGIPANHPMAFVQQQDLQALGIDPYENPFLEEMKQYAAHHQVNNATALNEMRENNLGSSISVFDLDFINTGIVGLGWAAAASAVAGAAWLATKDRS